MSIGAARRLVRARRPQDQPDRHARRPSFVADTLGALRVVDAAVVVVNAVMGVEVHTERLWQRRRRGGPGAARLREHARPRAGRLLPRARLAQGGLRPARGRDRDPDRLRARGARRDRPDRHEGVRVRGRGPRQLRREIEIPEELAEQAEEYREKLMDEVAENSDELMERYLEGEEISHDEIVTRAEEGRHRGAPVPGHLRRRDQEPRHQPPARGAGRGPALAGDARARSRRSTPTASRVEIEPDEDGDLRRLRLQDHRRPLHRPDQHAARLLGRARAPTRTSSTSPSARRSGSASSRRPEGKEHEPIDELGPGDIGAVAKLRETRAGDVLAGEGRRVRFPPLDLPAPVMAFAYEPKSKGDEEKAATAIRRLERGGPDARRPPRPADRRADHRRADPDPRRGDRRPDEAPLRRRDRAAPAAGPVPRDDPQAGQGARPLQEADRRPRPVRRLPHRDRAGRARRRASSSSTRSRAA